MSKGSLKDRRTFTNPIWGLPGVDFGGDRARKGAARGGPKDVYLKDSRGEQGCVQRPGCSAGHPRAVRRLPHQASAIRS